MPAYLLLLRINPTLTSEVVRTLKSLTNKPSTGVRLYHTNNVFGKWDVCIWFDADTHDNAMNFVQNKIRPISGITETYTMPTTTIKEYKS